MQNWLDIDDITKEIIKFRDERDWEKFHNIKDLSIGLSIEASELLENFLWKTNEEIDNCLLDNDFKKRIQEELADIMIFYLLISNKLNINLEKVIRDKLKINSNKYPVDKSRGNAKKYTDLEN